MVSSHSINFHIALQTNEGDFEVYIFHMQTFFMAFIYSLGLLLPNSTILKLSVCQNSEFLLRHLEMSTR